MSAVGFVYAIESGDAVKIGFAGDPVQRLCQLQSGSPVSYRLLGFIAGTRSNEAAIHKACQRLRIRGEWFRNIGAIRDIIATFTPYCSPSTDSRDISGSQIRAARRLLGMRTVALAIAAGVSPATVQRFETGATPIAIVKTAIVSALERAEIEFIPEGVRIKRREAAE